jgi:hypothetical protein
MWKLLHWVSDTFCFVTKGLPTLPFTVWHLGSKSIIKKAYLTLVVLVSPNIANANHAGTQRTSNPM